MSSSSSSSSSSRHTAILQLELLEGFYQLPVQIEYTFHPKIPGQGPSWDSPGEPEEPALAEVDSIESCESDRPLPDWMLELIWQYVQEYKLDDLIAMAEEDKGEGAFDE